MSIEIRNLNKSFGNFKALSDIDVTVPRGSLVSLLGPSGCGKTTLLRIIAGLEFADSGQVLFDGLDMTNTPVRKRKSGFMFQNYALFRHMTVFDNIAFGLNVMPRSQRPSKQAIKEKVNDLLKLIQLPNLARSVPSQLSGGQRQRVALARALAVEPKLLLLDEPFGALDAKVRKELRQWLLHIHHEMNITSLLVTHDQEEALEISDQIVLMNKGRVEQTGDGDSLFEAPKSPFVSTFMGDVSSFVGQVQGRSWSYRGFRFSLDEASEASLKQGDAVAYVGKHQWQIDREQGGDKMLSGKLNQVHNMGPWYRLSVNDDNNDQEVNLLISHSKQHRHQFKEGEQVYLSPTGLNVFNL